MHIKETDEKDLSTVRNLFIEYQQSIGVDLCFQGFDEELETLPGKYSPPSGLILLAIEEGKAVGCVAVRPSQEHQAELKRLYVKPAFQGRGIGKQLFHRAMFEAKAMGYASVVLDTLPMMKKARALYIDYGFLQIPAYYNNPQSGAEYYRYVFH